MSRISEEAREVMDQIAPSVFIHGLSFDHVDDAIEITYAEYRDQVEGAGMLKTIAFQRELFKAEWDSLESDLIDLIDEVCVTIRNEDARQQRIDKAMERFKPKGLDDEEEGDDGEEG